MIVIIIESTKRRGRHLKKKICLTRIRHILFPMSPQWLRKSHIIELGCRGVWGAQPPSEAMTFNEKKDQWNTSDPPNTWQNTWPPPLPIGHFIFKPPPSTSPKKFPTPPPLNIKVGVLLKWNNSKSLGKGLACVRNLLVLTTKFYFQNQSPKCRVDGLSFVQCTVIFYWNHIFMRKCPKE